MVFFLLVSLQTEPKKAQPQLRALWLPGTAGWNEVGDVRNVHPNLGVGPGEARGGRVQRFETREKGPEARPALVS